MTYNQALTSVAEMVALVGCLMYIGWYLSDRMIK